MPVAPLHPWEWPSCNDPSIWETFFLVWEDALEVDFWVKQVNQLINGHASQMHV